jgi:hypothetical protein
MSKQPGRSSGKRRPQARKGRTAAAARSARKGTDYTAWMIAAAVIVVGGALVVVFASGSKHTNSAGSIKGREKAKASLVSAVTGVKPDVLDKVGAGSVTGLPKKLPGPPLATADGKPRIVYLGAEYCPFCAAERWGMVNALSRFGTFTNLQITTSGAPPETPADIPTWSFHGATYKSDYIQFEPVEQQDNERKPLEVPTSEQDQLLTKYDAPPYVSGSAGAIPFIDFANQYVISGASYDPTVLQGKTHAEIAAALSNPSTEISRGAIGSANAITATICKIDGNKPAKVCSASAVKTIEGQLP